MATLMHQTRHSRKYAACSHSAYRTSIRIITRRRSRAVGWILVTLGVSPAIKAFETDTYVYFNESTGLLNGFAESIVELEDVNGIDYCGPFGYVVIPGTEEYVEGYECQRYYPIATAAYAYLFSPSGLVHDDDHYDLVHAYVDYAIDPSSEPGWWTAVGEHYLEAYVEHFVCTNYNSWPENHWPYYGGCQPSGFYWWDWVAFGSTQWSAYVEPPPQQCTNDPPYQPVLQNGPTVDLTIGNSTLLGATGFLPDGSLITGRTEAVVKNSLQCVQRCVEGNQKWRLEGDIALDPFTLKVRNGIPAVGTMCIDESARPQQFIDYDKAHEDIHANVILTEFDVYDRAAGFPNGSGFSSQTSCMAALTFVATQAATKVENTIIAEGNHPHHAGQQRTQRACPVQPGGPALPVFEEWCGNMNGNTPFVLMCQTSNTW